MNDDSNKPMSQAISQPVEYSWKKVLLWALLFYLVWNWKNMGLVFSQGVLPGPDDFLRLHQVQNWLSGQGWYDLTAYRMSPIHGADIHWSRLVDIPIATLILVFELFTEPTTAWRLAAIIWPLILFMIAVTAMISICDRIAGREHRLLAVFFFVLSINTMTEFRPGRLDHHNIQIVLLIAILLGVTHGLGKFSNYWVGFLMVLSFVVGLDSFILILAILGFLALSWAFNQAHSQQRLFETGLSIGISSVVLYAISTAPANWFSYHACDAYSLFYTAALALVSLAFMSLVYLSRLNIIKSLASRLLIGLLLSAIMLVLLFSVFPHCLDGPLGMVSAELKSRWLDQITEAKGLVERITLEPYYWSAQAVYLSIIFAITIWVVYHRLAEKHVLAILGFIIVVCILGSFYQTRILRTGMYSIIPLCVIFASMTWSWLVQKFKTRNILAYFIQGVVCIMLTSTFWVVIGLSVGSLEAEEITSEHSPDKKIEKTNEPKQECRSDIAMKVLSDLPKSHVLSDLNTSTSILVHTRHSVEAGSYHRNGKSILNVLSFFEMAPAQSRKIADERNVDLVVICRKDIPPQNQENKQSTAIAIGANQLPEWLEWVSDTNVPLAVLKVVR